MYNIEDRKEVATLKPEIYYQYFLRIFWDYIN